jgi:hypothetical protein
MDIARTDAAEPQVEKPGIGQIESVDQNAKHSGQIAIDPEAERRLVRKLDKAIIPLVMALCQSSAPGSLAAVTHADY